LLLLAGGHLGEWVVFIQALPMLQGYRQPRTANMVARSFGAARGLKPFKQFV